MGCLGAIGAGHIDGNTLLQQPPMDNWPQLVQHEEHALQPGKKCLMQQMLLWQVHCT